MDVSQHQHKSAAESRALSILCEFYRPFYTHTVGWTEKVFYYRQTILCMKNDFNCHKVDFRREQYCVLHPRFYPDAFVENHRFSRIVLELPHRITVFLQV